MVTAFLNIANTSAYKIFRLGYTLCIFVLLSPPLFAADTTYQHLVHLFDRSDSSLNNGNGFSFETNEKGNLAWGESYILNAYLDMYEATKNVYYLRKFTEHADRVIANTDNERGEKDYIGRSLVGWGSTKYSRNGERVVWLVHTGLITYPLVRFSLIVNINQVSYFAEKADIYSKTSIQALSEFDNDWVVNKTTGEGYYQFEHNTPVKFNNTDRRLPLPFNQQLAAGRTFILLFQSTRDTSFKKKAAGLALHFKNNIHTHSNGTYVWNYWYGRGHELFKAKEDISHGAIDIDFVVLAAKNNLVFTTADIMKFKNTYLENIENNGKITRYVDGSGAQSKGRIIPSGWLSLFAHDCNMIKKTLIDIVQHAEKKTPFILNVLAKAILLNTKCIYGNILEK